MTVETIPSNWAIYADDVEYSPYVDSFHVMFPNTVHCLAPSEASPKARRIH
jgi:hypothetical protein